MATNITQGSWLGGYGSSFQVVDNGAGSYTVDQVILGLPCGVTTGGTLFTVDVEAAGGDGTGTITVTDVTFRDGHQSILATRMRTEDMEAIASEGIRIGVDPLGGSSIDF